MSRRLMNLPSLRKVFKSTGSVTAPEDQDPSPSTSGEQSARAMENAGGTANLQSWETSPITFRHDPIDLTCHSIRVFRIVPGSGPVSCEIKHVKVYFPYTAISYVCGPSTPTATIAINGYRYEIRQSLNRILLRLRQEEQYDDYFWADAICINESDVKDRNVQVGYMGEIYSHADNVVSWISTDDERLERFLKVVIGLHKMTQELPYSKERVPIRAVVGGTSFLTDEHKLMLKDFCRSSYYSRTWICQEVILPTGLHTARCGATMMPWRSLCVVLSGLIKELPYSITASLSSSGPAQLMRHLTTDYSGWRNGEGPSALRELINRFKFFECSDPRDHIYALGSLWDSKSSPIQPDYGKSCAALFWDLMYYLGSDENILSRLLQVTNSDLRQAMPNFTDPSLFLIKKASTVASHMWTGPFFLNFKLHGSTVATYTQQFPTREVRICFCPCESCTPVNRSDATEHSISFTGLSNGRLLVRLTVSLPSILRPPHFRPQVLIGFASASRARTALGESGLEFCVILPAELNGNTSHIDFSEGIRVSEVGLLAYMDVQNFEPALDRGRTFNGHVFPTE